MGEFMSRIVTTFEKDNKKKPRRRKDDPTTVPVSVIPPLPTANLSLEEQILNDMLKSYQEDRDENKPQ
jgi:hypothetical protein